MFERQRRGSVVCPGCRRLVGVQEEQCWNCGRARPSVFGFSRALQRLENEAAFSSVVIGICVVIYVLELLMSAGSASTQMGLGFLSPSRDVGLRFGASGAPLVFEYNRWWTLLSAGWLHGGLLHIAFNMYMVYRLGPMMAGLLGVPRAAIIYLLSSVAGFALTTLMPLVPPGWPFVHYGITLGASAAVFGWLGALLWVLRQRSDRLFMSQVLGIALPMVIFSVVFRGIDHWAHFGGLAGGWVLARLFAARRTEEGPGETLVALALLVISVLAVPFSFLVWPP